MGDFEVIAFDIDGTLTRSKQSLEEDMAKLLCQLLDKYKVAIISGASYKQFQWQVLSGLKCAEDKLKRVYLLPADGTVFCTHDGENWQCEYDEPLTQEEKGRIKQAFDDIFVKVGLEEPEKIYGELIEDRGAQLNFSAFGQDAPVELKENWDQDLKKRQKIVRILEEALPDYVMHIGGTTSIEVTKPGIDKAYGLNKLLNKLDISKDKVLYVGDKLSRGGNDEPALKMGLKCEEVNDPEGTKRVIRRLLG